AQPPAPVGDEPYAATTAEASLASGGGGTRLRVSDRPTSLSGARRRGRWAERPRSVRRGQPAHLRQDPLLQALVLHVLRQGVKAVRVLNPVAADDLADAVLRLGGPVLAVERGRRLRRRSRRTRPQRPRR